MCRPRCSTGEGARGALKIDAVQRRNGRHSGIRPDRNRVKGRGTDMSHTASQRTIVQLLFEDPRTINNEEIKVWVKAEHPDERLFEGVDEYIDTSG